MNPFQKNQNPDLQAFVLHDTKTNSYNAPMFALNKFDMIRQLENLMRDPNQTQNQYLLNAEDYQLFHVADYYKKTAELNGKKPEHIANLHEIRAAVQQKQT